MLHYNKRFITWKFIFLNLFVIFIPFLLYGDKSLQEAVQECDEFDCNEKQESRQYKEIKGSSIKRVLIRITKKTKTRPCRNCYEVPPPPFEYISVEKTETGAIAEYGEWRSHINVEFNAEEWQNFIKAFSKLRIGEWERDYGDWGSEYGTSWRVRVTSLEKIEFHNFNAEPQYREYIIEDTLKGYNRFPPAWDELKEIMKDMKTIILKKSAIPLENKLKEEYQKRFGTPISDFELSIKKVIYNFDRRELELSRTKTGVYADFQPPNWHTSLFRDFNMNVWLDFIRALRKCRIDEWKSEYGDETSSNKNWKLEIYTSNKLEPDTFEGYGSGAFPPNWKDLKKTMDDMRDKIRKGRKYAPL